MKPINTKIAAAMPVVGLLLLAASFLLKSIDAGTAAAGFTAGIGSAWIGLGVLGLIIKRLRPEYVKKLETEQKDERNMQIREKSGYVSFLATLFSMVVLEIIFLLTDNDIACILVIGAMAVHIASFIIALFYYDKKL